MATNNQKCHGLLAKALSFFSAILLVGFLASCGEVEVKEVTLREPIVTHEEKFATAHWLVAIDPEGCVTLDGLGKYGQEDNKLRWFWESQPDSVGYEYGRAVPFILRGDAQVGDRMRLSLVKGVAKFTNGRVVEYTVRIYADSLTEVERQMKKPAVTLRPQAGGSTQ